MHVRALALAASLAFTAAACADAGAPDTAGPERGDVPDVLPLAADKADAPSWFARSGAIASGTAKAGSFRGTDSAHLYRYVAMAGQRLYIDASVALKSGAGFGLAVYGPKGQLVDSAYSAGADALALEIVVDADGAYEVGVYSGTWRATGDYTLMITVPCGSRGIANACSEGTFCKREIGALCGWADAPGTCVAGPTMCPMVYQPVCGCDGHTYSNGCAASAAQMSVLHDGPCESDGPDEPTEPTGCTANDQCADGLSCQGVPSYMEGGEGCCIDTARIDGEGHSCEGDGDCQHGLLCIGGQCSPEWMANSFESAPGVEIPDNDPAGVSDTIVVSCLATVPVTVTADVVIEHTWIGDLTVTITDPSGDVVTVLHDQTGGSADDLVLEGVTVNHTGDDAVNGPWTLRAVDSAGYDVGRIVRWTLRATSRWD